MARVPMVTRTIVTTKAKVLCLDLEKAEPFHKEVVLPRTYKDEKALMKKVSALVDNATTKAVHVVEKEEVETLYGMTEQEFITKAKVMQGRGKETVASDGEETEATDGEETEATDGAEAEATDGAEAEATEN